MIIFAELFKTDNNTATDSLILQLSRQLFTMHLESEISNIFLIYLYLSVKIK